MRPPLDGLLVADFSRVLAGPMATSLLADLGATVVKVERPGMGDDTRQWGPPWTATSSAYFECANRTKRSVMLDMEKEEDRRLARELADRADILVENFKDGQMAARGLGYDDLAASNEKLVYCSITGFGSSQGRELPGYDFLVQAVGGLMSITGPEDGEPARVGVALIDVLTSKDAVIGILAALRTRQLTGRGERIEVNLLSSLLGSLANQVGSLLATGRAPTRMGNQHPSIAPYETLACRDGLLAVCCGNDRQFRDLTEVLGIPEMSQDERFFTNADRVAHRRALVDGLETALSTGNVEEWAVALTDVGVPAGAVGDIASAIRLAEELGLQPIVPMGEGRPAQVRHPIKYSLSPVVPPDAPPALGEHDSEIRAWLQRQ